MECTELHFTCWPLLGSEGCLTWLKTCCGGFNLSPHASTGHSIYSQKAHPSLIGPFVSWQIKRLHPQTSPLCEDEYLYNIFSVWSPDRNKRSYHPNKEATESRNDLSSHWCGPKTKITDCVISAQTHKGTAPIKAIAHDGAMGHQFKLTLYRLKIARTVLLSCAAVSCFQHPLIQWVTLCQNHFFHSKTS